MGYQRLFARQSRPVTVDQIKAGALKYFRTTETQLLSPDTTRRMSRARQIISYLARKHTQATFQEIGFAIGRSYVTAWIGQQNIVEAIRAGDRFAIFDVAAIEAAIEQPELRKRR